MAAGEGRGVTATELNQIERIPAAGTMTPPRPSTPPDFVLWSAQGEDVALPRAQILACLPHSRLATRLQRCAPGEALQLPQASTGALRMVRAVCLNERPAPISPRSAMQALCLANAFSEQLSDGVGAYVRLNSAVAARIGLNVDAKHADTAGYLQQALDWLLVRPHALATSMSGRTPEARAALLDRVLLQLKRQKLPPEAQDRPQLLSDLGLALLRRRDLATLRHYCQSYRLWLLEAPQALGALVVQQRTMSAKVQVLGALGSVLQTLSLAGAEPVLGSLTRTLVTAQDWAAVAALLQSHPPSQLTLRRLLHKHTPGLSSGYLLRGCIEARNCGTLEMLLDLDTDPNAPYQIDQIDHWPLGTALQAGKDDPETALRMVQTLLAHGANPACGMRLRQARAERVVSPLSMACQLELKPVFPATLLTVLLARPEGIGLAEMEALSAATRGSWLARGLRRQRPEGPVAEMLAACLSPLRLRQSQDAARILPSAPDGELARLERARAACIAVHLPEGQPLPPTKPRQRRLQPPLPAATPWEAYCDRLSVDGAWGGSPELYAASEVFGRRVMVYSQHGATLYYGSLFTPETERAAPVALLRVGDNHYMRFLEVPPAESLQTRIWRRSERLQATPMDGNCMFHALGDAEGITEEAARGLVVAWLRAHPEADLPGHDGISLAQYAAEESFND